MEILGKEFGKIECIVFTKISPRKGSRTQFQLGDKDKEKVIGVLSKEENFEESFPLYNDPQDQSCFFEIITEKRKPNFQIEIIGNTIAFGKKFFRSKLSLERLCSDIANTVR